MRLALVPPGKEKIRWTVEYYERQMAILEIDLRLGLKAEGAAILETTPDAIILATGSKALPCPFKAPAFTADEILSKPPLPRDGEAAILGGGSIGCETALFLQERRYRISLFEQLDEVAHDMEPISAWDLRGRMARAQIRTHPESKVVDVEDRRIKALKKDGRTRTFGPFELIVWAGGRKPDNFLFEALGQSAFSGPVCVIGDAAEVGTIHDAVHQGYAAARDL